ncbi:putative tyrosinase-like protein tyr-3 [Orbicella faveolata]|uniref:putative tyrosinase-like protein tyr-3 n=1 Tax=Orbicella faveolata TaxID=48498 RepID=UPI0009E1E2A6|nr:putative tyrosinase-like protein tyr-3 [Orbicella faveolata]
MLVGCCAGVCYDSRPDCKVLARDNHCHANPWATLRQCPIACAVPCEPCVDHRHDCPSLKDDCHSNPFSTIYACPKTCGACY